MRKIYIYMVCALAATTSFAQQRTLTLDECKKLAAHNDPYERNAELDVLAARAQKQEALAEYFPSVSATAIAFHSLNPLLDIGVTDILGTSDAAWNIQNYVNEMAPQYGLPTRYQALQHGYGATISVMQPLYAGGRIVNGNRLASLGIQAAELKKSLQHRTTDGKVEEKYWLVVSLQEKQKTLDSANELLDSLAKDLDSAIGAGLATESDRMILRLKKSELASAGVQLRGGLRLAKMDLFNAIGQPYSAVRMASGEEKPYIDDICLSDVLDDLKQPQEYYIPEEQLAASMEETKLLELQLEAKELERKMVLGETLPQVGLGATYGYGQYIGQGSTNGALYAMVKVPISDWGKASKKLKRYGYEIEKTRNEKDYLDAQLMLRARQLWINLGTAWEQIQVADESVNYASDVCSRQAVQFSAGMITLSELLQSQTSLRQAEDEKINAQIAYRQALSTYLSIVK